MVYCESSIGVPGFVTYLHDAPILVVVITLPLYRPSVPYRCDATSVQVIADFLLSTSN